MKVEARENAIIIDLDGTLANCDHRVHHLEGDTKDWDSFYSGLRDDELHPWCKTLMEAMNDKGYKLLIVTGREAKYKEETKEWLEKYNIFYHFLYMRDLGDHRSDSEIKKEIYKKEIESKYHTLFVLDDRKSVVKMWRDLGLTCLQCDWGEF
jgi:histidinol phosphatase-like enzyme